MRVPGMGYQRRRGGSGHIRPVPRACVEGATPTPGARPSATAHPARHMHSGVKTDSGVQRNAVCNWACCIVSVFPTSGLRGAE
eukprot:2596288-Rhodomonas_salina.3